MGYGKLAKGVSEREAKRKLQNLMPVNRDRKKFQGASPPSIFVGSHGYPKVNTGILSPQMPGDSSMMDSPADWYREDMGIERIASLRTSLVNSRKKRDAKTDAGSIDATREVAMAKKTVDLEVELEKRPGSGIAGGRVKPVSAAGNAEQIRLTENPSVVRKLEDAFYDKDLGADTAVKELYGSGVDFYSLQQSMSAGMLGEEDERKLVPTRWSITATDDTASKALREQVKSFQELGEIRYFRNEYVGNTFHVFLIPGRWEYELAEHKRSGSVWNSMKSSFVASNYEPYSGRTDYADETSGAYYAARLGALEYLSSIKRQAKVLIVRDVTPDYWAPLGVWVIRETVRDSFENYQVLENFADIKRKLSREFTVYYPRILSNCRMLSSRQETLDSFLKDEK